MIRRADITVKDALGTPSPGIYITVKDVDGNLATLLDDDGSALGNPIVSGIDGAFHYNVSDDDAGAFYEEYRVSLSESAHKVWAIGLGSDISATVIAAQNEIEDDASQIAGYVGDVSQQVAAATAIISAISAAPTSGLSLAANSRTVMAGLGTDRTVVFDGDPWVAETKTANPAWSSDTTAQGFYVVSTVDATLVWRRQFDGVAHPRWWGWSSANTAAANDAALAAMKVALAARAYVESGFYQAVDPVQHPKGNTDISTTFDFDFGSVLFQGRSTGAAGPNATILNALGCTALRTQRTNTSGAAGAAGSTHAFSDGSIIRALTVYGNYSGTEAENHAFHLRAHATLENVVANNLAGDGIHWDATSGGNPEGNVNSAIVRDVRIYACRDNISTKGADGNACWFQNLDLASARRWNISELSFLGNTYMGMALADGGITSGTIPCLVSYSGNQYGAIYRTDGDYSGASNNAPSGTTADTAYWYYIAAGGASPGNNINLWVSGTTYRAGGAVLCKGANNRSIFFANYFEGGQGLPQIDAPAITFGGIMAETRNVGTGVFVSGVGGGLVANTFMGKSRVDPTTGQRINYQIGELGVPTTTLFFQHPTYAPNTFRMSFGVNGGANYPEDLWTHYNNTPVERITGPTTGEQFGSGASQTNVRHIVTLALGPINNAGARKLTIGAAAPTTGAHAQGERVLNNATTSAGIDKWIGTAVGTPGTWVSDYVNARAEPTVGIGYVAGAGGTVTQATSRTTGVTLNKVCGQITLFSAAGSVSWQTFTVTNSAVAATDVIRVVQASGTDLYQIMVTAVSAGSFKISFATTGGTTTEQPVFNFAVIKAVAA